MRGTIARLRTDSGYGFIKADGVGGDRFFHSSSLDGGLAFHHLYVGQRVEFEDEPSERGPRACNVRPLPE